VAAGTIKPCKTMSADELVDQQIASCLNPEDPKSFFLFAGAGSGKTRALVTALDFIRRERGQYLKMNRKKVAIITYTNAACDEIRHRLDYNSLFEVRTIHSFMWELIRHYQEDIRQWLHDDLIEKIAALEELQSRGRVSQASRNRAAEIEQKTTRLEQLDQIRAFTYSPAGDNNTRDSLSHPEVIAMGAAFLTDKPLMQEILVRKFPVLFIDESQDTKEELMDAVFLVQQKYPKLFTIGLFGDMMQRIYNDGKVGLGKNLPVDWLTPVKIINYRCPVRVVALINKIRSAVDNQLQLARQEQIEGTVRLYVSQRLDDAGKNKIEAKARIDMSLVTGDESWAGDGVIVKTLILEHKMAARRMGFLNLFNALSTDGNLRTGLINGTLSGLQFFTDILLPLRQAWLADDQFAIATIAKQYSPLLKKDVLRGNKEQLGQFGKAHDAINKMNALWDHGRVPSLGEILVAIKETNLFMLPQPLAVAKAAQEGVELPVNLAEEEEEDLSDVAIKAWQAMLLCSFDELEAYKRYTAEDSPFGTHQGVKGLQFPRVMVIIDDDEAGGFLFSYDKLFGVKALTDTDRNNIAEGKDTMVERTRRLFYVACSRTEKSLAIVAYTDNPQGLINQVLEQEWFDKDEIVLL
jgi:DNA helicase-2/ATP-dependent DNA helicase PcrA